MPSIEYIPDEVVELVLHNLLSVECSITDIFKHSLFYLTICSRWRRLAKPLVFRKAIFYYEEIEGLDIEGTTEHLAHAEEADAETDAKVIHVKIVSNLDLAQTVGCSALIRDLEIRMHYLNNPCSGLAKAVELLENISLPLRINYMSMFMVHNSCRRSNRNRIDFIKTKLLAIGHNMTKCLPEIKHLEFFVSCEFGESVPFLYGQIAQHYADQLKTLFAWVPIKLSKQCVFPELECAKLRLIEDDDISLIKMCAEKLKELEISGNFNLPSLNFITMFDSCTDIELPNLKKLILYCYQNDSDDAAQPSTDCSKKWVLTKLSKLVVHDSTSNYNIHALNYMTLPNHIDSIDIEASNSIYEAIKNISLPPANKVKLSADSSETNPSITHNMNHVFKRFSHCQSSSMVTNSFRAPAIVDDITFTRLTCLTIRGEAGISILISLLEKLPNLTELIVYTVTLGNLPQEITIPEISQHDQHSLVPFNSNLKKISLGFISTEYSDEVVIPVVLYFLLKLPNLQTFDAEQVSISPFLAQLEQYKSFYPHICNVKFDFANNESDY